jgi:hypothetical protein
MANIYVYSAAAGAGTGADWANAYVTLKAAAEAAGTAAGDSIWVSQDHAETTGSALSVTFKNTAAAPGTVACVSRAGSVPPVAADLATTATVTTTGASTMTLNGGTTYIYGITFSTGSGAVNSAFTAASTNNTAIYFKNCTLIKAGTTGTSAFVFAAAAAGRIWLDNVKFGFGVVGDSINIRGYCSWFNTPTSALSGAVVPTSLIATSTATGNLVVDDVDLSAFTGTLVNNASGLSAQHTFINCKLAPGVVVVGGSVSQVGDAVAALINCDSGATNYRTEKYAYTATQTTETTIVRTGGASDGTTPISWKIVTTANAKPNFPFECLPITVWSDTTGAKTVSIYGYWDNAAVPNNDDIWIEVDYLGSAATPLGTLATSGKASFLATNGAIPSDTSTWGGGDTTTRFKMSATLTTALKGPITVRVKVAAATKTFYVDPKIEIV